MIIIGFELLVVAILHLNTSIQCYSHASVRPGASNWRLLSQPEVLPASAKTCRSAETIPCTILPVSIAIFSASGLQ
jgi:hypothetical protein